MEEYNLWLTNKEGKKIVIERVPTPVVPIEGRSILPQGSLIDYFKEKAPKNGEEIGRMFLNRAYIVSKVNHNLNFIPHGSGILDVRGNLEEVVHVYAEEK